jgi:arylsulfatase A-like enzyme
MSDNIPNIVYVHSHDTGRYVQPYGHPVPTPNIQRLADQGLLFRHAFCAAPTCSGSRACLLTGQWAHSNGMIGLAHRGFELYDYGHHIVHTLRSAGYWTGLVGEQHLSRDPSTLGYDHVVDIDNHHVDEVAPAALQLIAERPSDPFFLSIGFVGLAFPGAKATLTDRGLGVMLIVRGPGGFDGGKVSEALVSQIDLFPTLCEAAGIDRPDWLQGKSLMPIVRREADEVNDAIFAELTFHAADELQRAIRTQRHQYIRRFGERRTPVLPNAAGRLDARDRRSAAARRRRAPARRRGHRPRRDLPGRHPDRASIVASRNPAAC